MGDEDVDQPEPVSAKVITAMLREAQRGERSATRRRVERRRSVLFVVAAVGFEQVDDIVDDARRRPLGGVMCPAQGFLVRFSGGLTIVASRGNYCT